MELESKRIERWRLEKTVVVSWNWLIKAPEGSFSQAAVMVVSRDRLLALESEAA